MIDVRLTPDLQSALQEAAAANSADAAPIQSILMPGARTGARRYLSKADSGYLQQSFGLCTILGIPVSPDVSVRASNLEYRDDFLQEPGKADLVVLSYIFYEPSLVGIPMRENYVRQSPLAKDEEAWHKALKKSGARFAINVIEGDGDNEVPTRFFDRKPFTHIGTYAAPAINKNLALLTRDI